MFALVLLVVVAFGALGLGVGFPYLEHRWRALSGRRSEKKLLKGMIEADIREVEQEWETSPEELAEIEAELEKEMSEW